MSKTATISACKILQRLGTLLNIMPLLSGSKIFDQNLKKLKSLIKKLILNRPRNPNFEVEFIEFYRNQNQLTQTCLEAISLKLKQ